MSTLSQKLTVMSSPLLWRKRIKYLAWRPQVGCGAETGIKKATAQMPHKHGLNLLWKPINSSTNGSLTRSMSKKNLYVSLS